MEHSFSYKYPNLNLIEAAIAELDCLPHTHCNCYHCANNTKPLLKARAPRIVSRKEKKLNDSQALRLVLRQLAQHGFSGHAQAADTYLIESSTLVYSSRSGKMRLKEGQTNLEVKRQFDEQRRKGQGNLTTLNQVGTVISKIPISESLSLAPQPSKGNKEIALMSYKDNTEQILNEGLLSKIFEKRKNDPFWEDISHIMQFPPELRQPIQKYKYHYERTEETIPELKVIMERLGREIDNVQEKSQVSSKPESRGSYVEEEEFLENNPEMKLSKPSSQKISRSNSIVYPKARKYMSMFDSASNSYNFSLEERVGELQLASLEMVAFLEVTSHYRILNVLFEYFIDERGRLFLCSTREVIGQQLDSSELSIIHDRYHPLQQIGVQEMVAAKKQYDSAEEQQLWKICTAVVNECLQIRKIELNLTVYKKPSYEALLKIFLRIFPDFKSEEIFGNVNWKNELGTLIADIRKKTNRIIREDEGIRILRRFGIEFRRTFH